MGDRRTFLLAVLVTACAGRQGPEARSADSEDALPAPPLPWERDAVAPPEIESPPVLLRGGTVMTAAGQTIENGAVLLEDGVIVAVGSASDVRAPDGADVVDTTGRFVTPGIIDPHSHVGVYSHPGTAATADGNEATSPTTPQVDASDSFWPQDPAIGRLIMAGVTTIHVVPGSANLIGGRSFTVHLVPGRSAEDMQFLGAPDGMKMACGENPKRVYGSRNTAPSTRMGNVAGFRAAFQGAVEYRIQWHDWQEKWRQWRRKRTEYLRVTAEHEDRGEESPGDSSYGVDPIPGGASTRDRDDPGPEPPPPARDFGKEALVGVLDGVVLAQIHCYRADEMLRLVDLAGEFGFRIRAFHHAVEAYKIRDVLAREGVATATWPDWWGFKLEAYDAIPEALALLTESGARAVLHSDSAQYVQRFNQEAAKAMYSGRAVGIDVTDDQALRWITAGPAWVLGIDDRVGSLERGKVADVVVWSGHPWSTYTRADLTYIDGILRYDRRHPERAPRTDFELGLGVEPPR